MEKRSFSMGGKSASNFFTEGKTDSRREWMETSAYPER